MLREDLLKKLLGIEEHFEEIGMQLASPEVLADRSEIERLSREHKELTEVVATYRAFKKALGEERGTRELLASSQDPDMLGMAKDELSFLEKELDGLENRLRFLLLPKDPKDNKNVILEISAGTGGDEAGIFVGDLLRMYIRYCEERGWKVEIMQASHASSGGYKEVIALVSGSGVYSKLKFEKGVHRVQRVPQTESQGRIHTSTVTVAVLQKQRM